MSIELAILLTLLATTLVRVGVVLLKQAICRLTDEQARGVFRLGLALLHSPRALLGLALQAAGTGLFLAAVSEPSAPISILQPLRAFGIVVMTFLGVFILKERLGTLEWLGVAQLLIGILLLSYSLPSEANQTRTIAVPHLMMYVVGLGILGGFFVGMLRMAKKEAYAEVSCGLIAGILLGMAYLHMKVFFMALQDGQTTLVAFSLAAILTGLLGGFAVLLWSFRFCRALVVTTINFVLNQVIVTVGGWYCLGEHLPREAPQFWARVAGFVFILLGVVLLARFHEAQTPRSITPAP